MKTRVIAMFIRYEPAAVPLYLEYEPAPVYTKNDKVYRIWAGGGLFI